jgi:hypothetical protein
LIVGGITSSSYLKINWPVFEKAGSKIFVELNTNLGSFGTAITSRYMSTELGRVILMGSEIEYPIII